jgi:hypothetical protein
MFDEDQSSLISALKQRDRSAWSTVVDRHLGEVYGFVFHLVGGDRQIAEELNQETWLEAVDGIHRCDEATGSFRNWLFGMPTRPTDTLRCRWDGGCSGRVHLLPTLLQSDQLPNESCDCQTSAGPKWWCNFLSVKAQRP